MRIFIILFPFFSFAQEVVSPLPYNPSLFYSPEKNQAAKRQLDTLSLPFIDDFATGTGYPDPARWTDRHVFVNDNYPVNKLSYGVATFDGLNEFGLPHNSNSLVVNGPADTLTSQLIDLSLFTAQDSVFLSFAYQPQGIGDRPDEIDSLVLEFKILDTIWQRAWSTPGSDSIIADPQFKKVHLHLTNPFFFTVDFQFRFRNYATITGNNDHWHLDYVYMSNNRGISDTVINDISILNPATSFLKNYTSMPWNHFAGFENDEKKDTITLSFRNNYLSQQLMDYTFRVYEGFTGTPIYDEAVITLSFPPNSNTSRTFPDDLFLPFTPATTDSVLISIETSITENPISISMENNTVTNHILFHNYFAYDDGTAERAYGVEGQGMKKFAYQFNLNVPDTLRAILIHFAQINDNLSLRELTLAVWKEIGPEEDTLYYRERIPFYYLEERNGFAVYVLDTPLAVSGRFYVGWEQLFPESVQVGLDLNSVATNRMFYYVQGTWRPSGIAGAPLIRPVVGKDTGLIGTEINQPLTATQFRLYPNPAQDFIFIQSDVPLSGIDIFDMQGRIVLSLQQVQNTLEISALKPGLYCARVVNERNQSGTLRFIKL